MQHEKGTPQPSVLGLEQLKYSFFPQSKYPTWLRPQHLNCSDQWKKFINFKRIFFYYEQKLHEILWFNQIYKGKFAKSSKTGLWKTEKYYWQGIEGIK